MDLSLRRMLAFVTLVTVAWAQVAGLQRGYLCDCTGRQEVTAWDHCHSAHDHGCHDHDASTLAHDKNDHHDAGEESHDHPALKEQLLASSTSMAKRVVIDPCSWVAWLSLPAITPVVTEPSSPSLVIAHPPDPPRPWPARLAHTIELRV